MNKEKEILVSIVMASYNHENYVGEAIQSVINQTYKNWELIIIDDGSTDGTGEVIKSFLEDKRIKFFKQRNRGAAVTTNEGIKKARGEVICLLDSDDLWEKEKLFKQVEKYQQGSEIVCSKVQVIDADKNNLYPDWCERTFNNSENDIFDADKLRINFMTNNYFCKSSILIKRTLFDEGGYFDERYTNVYDYKKWVEFLSKTKLVSRCNEKLTLYRWHGENEANKSVFKTNLEMVLIFLQNFQTMTKERAIKCNEYVKRVEEMFDYKTFYRTVSFVSVFINCLEPGQKITDLIENKELQKIVKKYSAEDGLNDGKRQIKIMKESIFWKMRKVYLKVKYFILRKNVK